MKDAVAAIVRRSQERWRPFPKFNKEKAVLKINLPPRLLQSK